MLSGNNVGSNQGGQSSQTPSGSASRFALWPFFTFPHCTVFSRVPTLLVFRWVSTCLSNMTADLMFTSSLGSTWHCTSQFSLSCSWARGSHRSSTSSSSRSLGWIPSRPGYNIFCLHFRRGQILQLIFLYPLGTSSSSTTATTRAKCLGFQPCPYLF